MTEASAQSFGKFDSFRIMDYGNCLKLPRKLQDFFQKCEKYFHFEY